MRKVKFVSVFVLLALLLSAVPGVVLADEPPPDEPLPGAVLADEPVLGPPVGYRVDEPSPGAVVHREAVQPLGGRIQSLGDGVRPMTTYRSGWTNAWHEWHWPLNWGHVGSHNSDSDLVEDEIWVDGFMKIKSYWDDSCKRHTSGTSAHCRTELTYHLVYNFYVESHHTFHKAGYPDTYFETGKSI
jgi:hypothetical protein